jgi:hypothetical protein
VSQPGTAPRPRPSRASPPATLRVVSERVTPQEAVRLPAAVPAPPPVVQEPATATVTGPAVAPTPRAVRLTPVRDVTPGAAAVAGLAVVDTRPALAPLLPARRGPWGRLADLVVGRRRAGRHRPDTLYAHGWSMFAPQRRSRRWGVRAH